MKSKRIPDPKIIRSGDWVRVINPVVFDRCGYAVSIDTEQDRIEKTFMEYLQGLSVLVFGTDQVTSRIARALAYESVAKARKDGAKREIYAHEDPALLNRVEVVIDRKVVYTGVYEAGYVGYEDDYSGAVLMQPKAHVILRLRTGHWIEVSNVKKCDRYKPNEEA